ncbi:unnamed protein product [Prunus armeniaca]
MRVEVQSSRQAPKYSDPELFTIEIHHEGILKRGSMWEALSNVQTTNLLQPQLIHIDVQDHANIADHADDEAKEEDEKQQEDEELQVDEEEDVNVDGEDDNEERLQFIDSDDKQTDEEQDKQKRAEDDKWFDRHLVNEAV